MLDIVIRNGQVVTPDGVGQWDVAIQGEKIVAVSAPGVLTQDVGRVIDATGKAVIPGGIDPHVHTNSVVPNPDGVTMGFCAPPKQVSPAALYGGTTTLIDFAVVKNGEMVIEDAIGRQDEVWREGYGDYALYVHLQGEVPFEVLQQIPETIQAGFPTIKVFTTDVKPARKGRMVPTGWIMGILEQTARHGGIVAVHAEDNEIVQYMYDKLKRENRSNFENMAEVHSKLSEDLSFRHVMDLARHIEGAALYMVHTSAEEGVEAIAEARGAGRPVYGETLHNYACFDTSYYHKKDGVKYQNFPSLKFKEDVARLWSGLANGTLSTVATDELCTSFAVKVQNLYVYNATGGQVGVETRLPIVYTEGVSKRGMSLERFVEITSTNAAKLFGLYPQKGAIAVGSDADIVILDTTVQKTLRQEELHGSDYSIWDGWEVRCWPVITLLRGQVAVENGVLKAKQGGSKRPYRKLSAAVQDGTVM